MRRWRSWARVRLRMTNRIYSLTDPRDGRIRYIGVTSGSLANRLKGHLQRARQGENSHRARWMRVLLGLGLKPIIALVEETEDRSREIYWIGHYRSVGCDLTNCTEGGDGSVHLTEELRERIRSKVTGFRHTEEAKAKISEEVKRHWQNPERRQKAAERLIARSQSEETRRHTSERMKGVQIRLGHKNSPEHRAKISAALKGKPRPSSSRPMSEETKRKIAEANRGNQWNKGRQHTDDARANMSKAKLGNTHAAGHIVSEETRAKISAAVRAAHTKKNLSK